MVIVIVILIVILIVIVIVISIVIVIVFLFVGRDERGVRREDRVRPGARPVRHGLHRREQGGEGVGVS